MEELISWTSLKIKSFHSTKDKVKRIRRQATDWEKMFAKDTTYKELLFKTYIEFLNLNNKKLTTWKTSGMNWHSSKKLTQMDHEPKSKMQNYNTTPRK